MRSRKRIVVIAAVVCVCLTSIAAGLVWRQWIVDSQASVLHIDHLRQYEEHWKVLNADQVRVEDWNKKAVLINFWGSWCPPCVEEMPLLDQFNDQHSDIQIVGIVVDQEEAAVHFLAQNEIEFPSLLLNQSVVTNMLQSLKNDDLVLPYSVAYNKSGKSLFTKAGPLSKSDLEKLLQ